MINQALVKLSIVIWLLATASFAVAQEPVVSEKTSKLDITLKNISTSVEKSIVAGAIKLTQNPGDIFYTNCAFKLTAERDCTRISGNAVLLDLVPEFDIKASENGAFQSFTGKITGNFITFNTRLLGSTVPGVDNPNAIIPDMQKPMHVFPVSAGVETTRFFDNVAVLGEVGYVPYVLNSYNFLGAPIQLGINPVIGAFFQAGYKFKNSKESGNSLSIDKSKEQPNSVLARFKADARFEWEVPVSFAIADEEIFMKLLPWATGWYDLHNNEFYHSVGVKLRFNVPQTKDTSIEFVVEDGSGAPNFNPGTQFGIGLTVVY